MLSYVDHDEDRWPDLAALLEASENHAIEIVTSSLSTVEVAYGQLERSGQILDEATEAQIESLWAPGGPIKVVEFHPIIAREARQLMRLAVTKTWKLKPADAIHLATGINSRSDEVNTYDDKWKRFESAVGCTIRQPTSAAPKLL